MMYWTALIATQVQTDWTISWEVVLAVVGLLATLVLSLNQVESRWMRWMIAAAIVGLLSLIGYWLVRALSSEAQGLHIEWSYPVRIVIGAVVAGATVLFVRNKMKTSRIVRFTARVVGMISIAYLFAQVVTVLIFRFLPERIPSTEQAMLLIQLTIVLVLFVLEVVIWTMTNRRFSNLSMLFKILATASFFAVSISLFLRL